MSHIVILMLNRNYGSGVDERGARPRAALTRDFLLLPSSHPFDVHKEIIMLAKDKHTRIAVMARQQS